MRFPKLLPALLALLPWAALQGAEVLVATGYPGYPPMTWEEDGALTGVAVELARRVFTELKVPFEIRTGGRWVRVQKDAEAGVVDVIVSAYVNEERKRYLDYTVSFMEDPSVVFVWKGKAFPFRNWEDLVGRRGTTNTGESFGEAFDRFAEQRLALERVPEAVQNLKKLESGRADYFLFGLYPGLSIAAIEGYDDRIEALPHRVVTADMCMAFSKKSKWVRLLPQVNRVLNRLKSEGAPDQLLKDYLEIYRRTHRKP